MTEADFIPKPYTHKPEEGSVTWQSPSNIALVKYWGKYPHQIPANASVSFTLDACRTITWLRFQPKEKPTKSHAISVFFDGKKADDFKPKIETFFNRIERYLPFINQYSFEIHTQNTFPHSSGIASSASGMSALALCLVDMEQLFLEEKMTEATSNRKASFLARLGSGSACRSIEGDVVVWGEHQQIEGSSNLVGINYPYPVHAVFKKYLDTILLVDVGEKQVSSTVGHGLMKNHPFSSRRFEQANTNLSKLISVFESGDLSEFIQIVESEALTLHAMMMTSIPYFVLMKPQTLAIIQKIWSFRNQTGVPVCFTLDAGANVHVLYPQEYKEKVYEFIVNQLVEHCHQGQYICDQIGFGAKKL